MKQILYFVFALYDIIGCISNVQCLQDVMWYRNYASDNLIWINRTEVSSVSKTNCALVLLQKNGSCFGFKSKTNKCYMKSGGEEMEVMNNVDVYCTDISVHVGNVAAALTTTTEQTTTNICPSPYTLQGTMIRTICYRIYNSEQQWSDARSTCQSKGGDLLVVEDPNMLKFYSFSRDDQFFFGMYHIQSNGDFKFVDGRTQSDITTRTFWKPDHPALNASDWCGYVKKRQNKPIVWVSSPCAVNKSFICEIPMASN